MKKLIVKKLFILAAVVTVLSSFLPTAVLAAPPAAPTGLIAITISGGQVDLHWTDSSADETGFDIFRAPDIGGLEPGTYAQIGTVAANVTTFSDLTVMGSTAYWYQLYAVNADGLSFPSNQVRIITPPAAPVISLTQPAPPNATIQSGANNVIGAMTNVYGGAVASADFQFIADNAPGVFDAHDILNPPMVITIPAPLSAAPVNNTEIMPALLPAGSIAEFEIRGTVSALNPTPGNTGEWRIGATVGTMIGNPPIANAVPPLLVYQSAVTRFEGSRVPTVGDAVKIIAYRDPTVNSALVAKTITYIAPAQPMGAPAVTISFLLNGAVLPVLVNGVPMVSEPPVTGAGYLLSGEIYHVGTGMFRVDAPDFPAYIDPSIGIGTNVTVRFAAPRAPANIARNIFRQVTKAIAITTDPNPVFDNTDVPLGVPPSTWLYVIVDGVVNGLDLVNGTWTIGSEMIKCYQTANTLVAPATYGDEVLVYARRTMTPGPIVVEQIHNILPGRLIVPIKGTAQEMHLMYNGVIQYMGPNTWNVGGQTSLKKVKCYLLRSACAATVAPGTDRAHMPGKR